MILFTPNNASGIYKVSEDGGVATPATRLDPGESVHRFPSFLPDGRHFLYQALRYGGSSLPRGTLVVGSLDDNLKKPLADVNSQVFYSRSGHLVYMHEVSLVAQKIDLKSLQLDRKLTPLASNVGRSQFGDALFSISNDGLLVYTPGSFFDNSHLQWLDASGKPLDAPGKAGDIRSPNLSHDGKRVAMCVLDAATGTTDIWIVDLVRNVSTRLTFNTANEFVPIWSPDDTEIVYGASAPGSGDLVVKRSSGTGGEEVLYSTKDFKIPYDWSPDGSTIIFQDQSANTSWDLWLYSFKDRRARVFVQTPAQEIDPKFSPDGRFIVYQSDESVRGRYQIYVLPVSGARGKWQISSEGGHTARWSADGKKIFYVSDDSMLMSVDVTVRGDEFTAALPVPLFQMAAPSTPGTQYDVSRDGKRFLVNVTTQNRENEPLTLVQNWTAKLK